MIAGEFQSKAPAKLHALLWAVILILLPAPAVFVGAWWAWLLCIPCLCLAGVLLLSIVAPKLFFSGVRLVPAGFEVRVPLHAARCIKYEDITQIDALVSRDGDMGLAVIDLVVRCKGGKVRLQEGLLFESGLLAQLQSLPAFNHAAFSQAQQYEPSGLTELFSKRFRVFNAT
jgi:hypothetical protein